MSASAGAELAPAVADEGRRARKKAANRAQILAAAREVFAELGYGAASIRDIVRGTELAAGTFYNYFPDKESVLRAMAEEDAAELRSRLRDGRARASTAEEFVANGFRAYFEFIVEDQSYFELMRRNAGTVRTLLDEPALGGGVTDLLLDLREAMERGELPAVDADFMTAAMVGFAFEVGFKLVEQEVPDVEAATRFATDLFIGGMERMARRDGAPGPARSAT